MRFHPAPTGGLSMHKFQVSHFNCRASVRRANVPSPASTALRTVGWDTQAQKRNRTAEIFLSPRAQWPGKNLDRPLRFYAPEILLNLTGMCPS